MERPRPSSVAAPSIWYADAANPQPKPVGKRAARAPGSRSTLGVRHRPIVAVQRPAGAFLDRLGPLGDARRSHALRTVGAAGHRTAAQGCGRGADRSGDAPLIPLTETMADVALLIVGMILGALAFSLVVGRYRARRLAKLTDRLAGVASIVGAQVPSDTRIASCRPRSSGSQTRIAEVEALATTDQLTRLLNRLACLQFLATEIERANRYDRQLAVALIDIDHFKRVNDTHGHAVGDEVLRQVAGLLPREHPRRSTRSVATAARSSCSSCPRRTSTARSRPPRTCGARSGGRPSRSSCRPARSRRGSRSASASRVGYGAESLDVDRLLREADGALYGAKALRARPGPGLSTGRRRGRP